MKLFRLLLIVLLAGPADAARVVVPIFKTGGPTVVQTVVPKLTVGTNLVVPTLSVIENLSPGPSVFKAPQPVNTSVNGGIHNPAVVQEAEIGSLSQVQALVENLPSVEAPAEQGSAALGDFFTGSKLASITEPAAPAPGEAPGYSSLPPSQIEKAVKKLGKVPKPKVGLAKTAAALYWGGLTALTAGLHAPFDRVGPLAIGVVLGGMMGLMGQFMIGSMSRVQRDQAARLPGKQIEAPAKLVDEVARIARSMGVPAPKAVYLMESEQVQAAVSGLTRSSYELHLTTKIMEQTSPAQLEAVLRHEFSHIRHYDGLSRAIQIWLAPILSGVALTAGVTGAPDALILPLFVLPLISFPFFMKLDEYHADQHAAAAQGSAAPLAAFFIKDADDSKAAASALSGKAFSNLSGWRRAVKVVLITLQRFFLSHPAHEQRVARLARLAAAPDGPAVTSVVKGAGPTEWLVNGKSVHEMGWGAFKRVVPHPDDPDYVVKLFVGFGDSMSEMRSDHARSKETVAAGLTPRITSAGAVLVKGKPTGYIVQERVHGAVESQPGPGMKAALSKRGLKLQDAEPMILAKNILKGRTLTGGERLWLVDPDVVAEVR